MIPRLLQAAAIVIGLALIVLYSIVARVGYDSMSLPTTKVPSATPAGDYQDVVFPSRGQNYQVRAFYLPGIPGRSALISVHGYKGSRHTDYELSRSALLRELGYTVVSVDLSDASGDTVGNGRISMGYAERWDVLGAYDYLLSKGFSADRIGLVGESMGAATILLAAAAEPRIRAVWADSPYTRADTVLSEQATHAGFPPIILPGGMLWGVIVSGDRVWEAAPIEGASTLATNKQAVYLVHCEPDVVVLFHHSVDLNAAYKAAGIDVTFWGVQDGEHASAIINHRAEYLQRLDAFFKQHLAT